MEKIVIKCHRLGANYTQPHFFVLNKGENSGKPLRQPCPNCYVVLTETAYTADYLFWLSWGMWQGKAFHPYLRGSVIEYVTIGDYRKLLMNTYLQSLLHTEAVSKAIKTLQNVSNTEIAIRKQLRLLHDAKRAIYHHKIMKVIA
jgi:hypothetical protein